MATAYLERNQTPLNKHGKPIENLDLSSSNYTDHDTELLAASLRLNTTYTGGLNLSDNLITDLGVLDLTSALSYSATPIRSIDLSGNRLNERSGILLGDYLSMPNNKLVELALTRCSVGLMGLQRIMESLSSNSTLTSLRLGEVPQKGLEVISRYLPKCTLLHFELTADGEWDE